MIYYPVQWQESRTAIKPYLRLQIIIQMADTSRETWSHRDSDVSLDVFYWKFTPDSTLCRCSFNKLPESDANNRSCWLYDIRTCLSDAKIWFSSKRIQQRQNVTIKIARKRHVKVFFNKLSSRKLYCISWPTHASNVTSQTQKKHFREWAWTGNLSRFTPATIRSSNRWTEESNSIFSYLLLRVQINAVLILIGFVSLTALML